MTRSVHLPQVAGRHTLRVLCVIVIWLLFFLVCFVLKPFLITQITCTNDDQSCSEPVMAELSKLQGHFFFSPAVTQTLQKIQKFEPNIEHVSVNKHFPHTLSISMHKQQPVLLVECTDQIISFSKQGDTLSGHSIPDSSSFPRLQASEKMCEDLDQNSHIDPQTLHTFISFIEKIDELHQKQTLLWQEPHSLLLTTPSQLEVIFPVDQLMYKAEVFAIILNQSDTDQFSRLDLRFSKPVGTTHTSENK